VKVVTYAEDLIIIHGLYYNEAGSTSFRSAELS